MKKVKLVLLGLSVTTMGFVSCEKDEQIRKKINDSENHEKNKRGSEFDDSLRDNPTDTLILYLTSPHGNKGEGKLGDD